MFIVRFVRVDKQPSEEYYYNTMEEARWHLSHFTEDDSELYNIIEVVDCDKPLVPIEVIIFGK